MIATSMCLKLAAAAAIALSVAHGTTGAGSPVSGDASTGVATRLESNTTIGTGATLSGAADVFATSAARLVGSARTTLNASAGATGSTGTSAGSSASLTPRDQERESVMTGGCGCATTPAAASIHGSTTATASLRTSPVSAGADIATKVLASFQLR